MIVSVERIKQLVSLDGWSDEKIRMKLDAIEQTIRAYTNNNFQNRGFRIRADIAVGVFVSESLTPFDVGDTVQVTESLKNSGLFTVSEAYDVSFMVNEDTRDEDDVLVTKVEYPADVVACAVNLMEWEVNMRPKVGVQSETLSRHSVTYVNMDGNSNSGASNIMGYPASLLGCLKAYRKARC
jgi:hypothetical protein